MLEYQSVSQSFRPLTRIYLLLTGWLGRRGRFADPLFQTVDTDLSSADLKWLDDVTT